MRKSINKENTKNSTITLWIQKWENLNTFII